MARSTMLKPTLQATCLAALSNAIAQYLKARQSAFASSGSSFKLQYQPIMQFIIFSLITAPINISWQSYLERTFPSSISTKEGQPRRSNRNTVIKIMLDQSVGAVLNTLLFLMLMGALKGANGQQIAAAVQRDFWPMMKAGWSLWPLVSIVAFTVIPPEQRVVFGSLVGVGWNVFLSMKV